MLSRCKLQFERRLTHAWLQRGALAISLLPIAFVYAVLVRANQWFFKNGLRKSTRLPVKVIIVGNVVAGGAGKTPTVIALAERLANDGYRVGLISRGYGRRNSHVQEVFPDSIAHEVGDEPLLLQRKLKLPMFVGRSRVAAARELLRKHPQVNILVCDDGIQHLQLFRDVEVYVFDRRGVGNGLPLPAGPLRSPWPPSYVVQAGQSAQNSIVLHTGAQALFEGHRAQRALAPFGIRSDGSIVELKRLQHNSKRRLVAIAGIAQPSAFFNMLAAVGIQPTEEVVYPDHYDFSDWTPPGHDDCIVLCTEKDAVKIWLKFPDALAFPLIQTMDDSFFMDLYAALRAHPSPSTRYD